MYGGFLSAPAMTPCLAAYLADRPAVTGLAARLAAAGLDGVFAEYLQDADEAAFDAFFADLAGADFAWMVRHRDAVLAGTGGGIEGVLEPVTPGTLGGGRDDDLAERGRASLQHGEWASLVFAGGAATRFYAEAERFERARKVIARFGSTPPKALFPLTPVTGMSFLELFAAQTLHVAVTSGRMPPLLLMTSGTTDGALRRFVAEADLQGFPHQFITLVAQHEHPRLDDRGVLLARPDGHLVFTGDGHGGVFRALLEPVGGGPSALAVLRAAGVCGIVLHNVDNAAARPLEPARLGFHLAGGYRMTITAVPRATLAEKVGLVARNSATERIEVVEYSICPRAIGEAALADGTPVFRLANINTNLVSLDAVRADLPPTLYTGKQVQIGNRLVAASSHEMLNQHLAALLAPGEVGVLEVARDDYFLPTKTLTGDDSLAGTMHSLSRQAAARLRGAGAEVADDATVELDPCLGESAEDLRRLGIGPGWRIGAGAALFLGVRQGIDGAPPYRPGLVLEPGARLVVRGDRPYGDVTVDAVTRTVSIDAATASRISIGAGVTVVAGARVELCVARAATRSIPAGEIVRGDDSQF